MQRQILIIDDHEHLAASLDEVLTGLGHSVTVMTRREDALAINDLSVFDIVIADLDVDPKEGLPVRKGNAVYVPAYSANNGGEHVHAFKICGANYRNDGYDEGELRDLVATILDYKSRFVDKTEFVQNLHENIEFELPSGIELMHVVLEYLMKRVEKVGVVKPEQSNLFVALDEAFVNAIKHGNQFDAHKRVKIAADISPTEARFTIEDEGKGFDVKNIPDPLDPENLFKTSGRGVLFIYNIMDEVEYNDRGNRLTMVKRNNPETVKSDG
jgi:serine/threonine-protein kinase RsbW